ncbi:hypothetical protein M8C21_029817 [Ambrosia artemisiifolia]|uniref:Oligopeptidase A N-terminal domain-containing protein n=1 Tax=Ambrosia artemisiifolia TaxID=4212 RepID=A0AAD5C2Q9_AMBAR|nr:hypothetical protein M8C21_029817 [Ambrosia artemisiifolia]
MKAKVMDQSSINCLLKQNQDSDLMELEKTVEPTWPKLVEPLEKMMDWLTVVWGAVNHLKIVKDTPELRYAIEEIQATTRCTATHPTTLATTTRGGSGGRSGDGGGTSSARGPRHGGNDSGGRGRSRYNPY